LFLTEKKGLGYQYVKPFFIKRNFDEIDDIGDNATAAQAINSL
jgi:hypothetical protein